KLRCKFQSALYPLLGEPHRLLLAHGIEEVASVMQPTHDIEVITFPGAVRVEEVGGKKRQDSVINAGLVVCHLRTLSRPSGGRNCKGERANQAGADCRPERAARATLG